MALYFMDSSAISEGYMLEVGSAWITSLIVRAAGHIIILSELTTVEVCSAIARKQRLK